MDVQRTLATGSQHRSAGIPDLLIAATAELNDAILLHYDQYFDVIADVTGQRAVWVVPEAQCRDALRREGGPQRPALPHASGHRTLRAT